MGTCDVWAGCVTVDNTEELSLYYRYINVKITTKYWKWMKQRNGQEKGSEERALQCNLLWILFLCTFGPDSLHHHCVFISIMFCSIQINCPSDTRGKESHVQGCYHCKSVLFLLVFTDAIRCIPVFALNSSPCCRWVPGNALCVMSSVKDSI